MVYMEKSFNYGSNSFKNAANESNKSVVKDLNKLKIAYIGGGSKQWARVFMNDLALAGDMSGSIYLYDIDIEAALRNQKIGMRINESPECVSKY